MMRHRLVVAALLVVVLLGFAPGRAPGQATDAFPPQGLCLSGMSCPSDVLAGYNFGIRTGKTVLMPESQSGSASFNMVPGTTPGTPNSGDWWAVTNGPLLYLGSSTWGVVLSSGTPTSGQVPVYTGVGYQTAPGTGGGGGGPTLAAGTNVTISPGSPCSTGTCTISASGGGGGGTETLLCTFALSSSTTYLVLNPANCGGSIITTTYRYYRLAMDVVAISACCGEDTNVTLQFSSNGGTSWVGSYITLVPSSSGNEHATGSLYLTGLAENYSGGGIGGNLGTVSATGVSNWDNMVCCGLTNGTNPTLVGQAIQDSGMPFNAISLSINVTSNDLSAGSTASLYGITN